MFEEALQIAEKREVEDKGEKERYTHVNAGFQRITRREKKFLISFLMFALRIKCLLKLILSFYQNEQTFFPIGVKDISI